jgi:sec-independent protein translocase protein TatB
MFDISWGKLVIIGVIALIVIGPKELPTVLRTVGQWMGKIRRMASEFQGQFQEAMREAEMSELKKDVDDLARKADDLTNFNPMESVQKDIDAAMGVTSDPNAAATTGSAPQPPADIPPAAPADIPPATPEPASTPGTDIPPQVVEPKPQSELATASPEPKSDLQPGPGRPPA